MPAAPFRVAPDCRGEARGGTLRWHHVCGVSGGVLTEQSRGKVGLRTVNVVALEDSCLPFSSSFSVPRRAFCCQTQRFSPGLSAPSNKLIGVHLTQQTNHCYITTSKQSPDTPHGSTPSRQVICAVFVAQQPMPCCHTQAGAYRAAGTP